MKITAIRHGHKSEEDLSELWIQQSVEVGEKMVPIPKNSVILSSPVKRVRDTLENILKGANYTDISQIRDKKYLGLSAIPQSFHDKNQARREKWFNQDEVIWEFLRWEWSEIKPKDIAQNFLGRILGLMNKMSKNVDQNIPDFILGTHQSIIESVILTLFDATDIPAEWKTPIWFLESAEFEILMREWKPYLIVSYRGYKKSLTFEEIKELYIRLFPID